MFAVYLIHFAVFIAIMAGSVSTHEILLIVNLSIEN